MRSASRGKVIGVGVHVYTCIYVYIYMFVGQKILNRTLAINSPFQTFAVGLLIELYRLALPLLSPEMFSSSSKPRIFLHNAHLALFIRMDDTITCTNT